MEKTDTYKGKVILHVLKDIIKHVWIKETIKFDLPRELDNPAPPASTGILNFSNQVSLYWRLYNKENRHVIQFYNVHSKESKEVKVPDEGYENCYEYYLSSHVENFLSLKTLATVAGAGNIRKVLKEYKKSSNLRGYLFKDILTSNSVVVSFLDPL